MVSSHPACPAFVKFEPARKTTHDQPSPSFHFLAQLPPELRNQIWHTAANRRRLIGGAGFCQQPCWKLSDPSHRVWDRPPAVAHVCRESRTIALGYGSARHFVILDAPWGFGGRIEHRAWVGKRDIWLWPHASASQPHGHEIWSAMKSFVREMLVPLAVDRDDWREAFDMLIQRLAFDSACRVQILDLFVPSELCGDPDFKTSPGADDEGCDIFGNDDVRMVDLRCPHDIKDISRYMAQPRPWLFSNLKKKQKAGQSPMARARDVFLVRHREDQPSLLEEICGRLMARWLWEKWHTELRRSRLPFKSKQIDKEAAWDSRQWNLKHPWCRKHLKGMPRVRPVYVVAKDMSWHIPEQPKERPGDVKPASKPKSWLQRLLLW